MEEVKIRDVGEKKQMSTYQSLTKWQKHKLALGNAVTEGVSEVVFCATIEWEQSHSQRMQ